MLKKIKKNICFLILFFLYTLISYSITPTTFQIGTIAMLVLEDKTEILSNIVVVTIVNDIANITIEKSFKDEPVKEEQKTLVFKILNNSNIRGEDLLLTDDLSNKYDIVGDSVLWTPFGENTTKKLTLVEDGQEKEDINVSLNFKNNILNFTMKVVGENQLITSNGGYLEVVIKPKDDLLARTILKNIAIYEYFNGVEKKNNIETNVLNYEVPIISKAIFTGESKSFESSGNIIYFTNILKNIGNIEDTYNIILANNLFKDGDTFKIGQLINNVFTEFQDTNKDGIIDTGKLTVGKSINIILEVTTKSSTLTLRDLSIEKIATSVENPQYNVVVKDVLDQLISSSSSVEFFKYQSLDKNNDNIIEFPYTQNLIGGNPENKIFYKIIVKNIDENPITELLIEDYIPEYTKMSYGDNSLSEKGRPVYRLSNDNIFKEIVSKPFIGRNGTIKVEIPILNKDETVEIYYNVKID